MLEIIKKSLKPAFIITLVIMPFVCIADDRQQHVLRYARYAYQQMEEGNYAEAKEYFGKYLASHPQNSLYWRLVEEVNGEDNPFTYKNVNIILQDYLA